MSEEKKKGLGKLPSHEWIYLIKNADGSEAILIKQWLNKSKADELLNFCKKLKTKTYPFGIRKNRPLWACGDTGTSHSFKSIKVDINEWPKEIKDIRDEINSNFDISESKLPLPLC